MRTRIHLRRRAIRLNRMVALLVLVAAWSSPATPQSGTPPLLDPAIEQAVLNELSGELAKEFVIDITRFDRVQASEGLYQACEMIKDRLAGYGITDAVIERFPSNGEVKYWTWTPPMGWRIRSAELWMVNPRRMKLADYAEMPTTVVRGSQSGEVTAELVGVANGTRDDDYAQVEVRGKIVLADGYAGDVHRQAVLKRGAAGVVTCLSRTDRMEFPDLVPYHGMWIRRFENPKTTWGFTISQRTAEMLKAMLARGDKILLHAKVDGENYDSTVDQLTCTIRGAKYPEEEVLLLGHIDHYKPGANDNASGSAGLLEMARCLKKMVARGDIAPPKRTIRFLWVTEWNGMVPWLQAHPELWSKTLAAINCDMIGGDLVKTNSYFYFTQTPHSLPHYLNDVAENFTHRAASLGITSARGNNQAPFNYRITPYSGGSDHWMLNDGRIRVPALMFGHPDPYHHTIQDAPDHIDPTELKRVMQVALGSILCIANAESQQAIQLGALVAANAIGALSTDGAAAIAAMVDSAGNQNSLYLAYKEGVNRLTFARRRETGAIASVRQLDKQGLAAAGIERNLQQLNNHAAALAQNVRMVYEELCRVKGWQPRRIGLTNEELAAEKLVPAREPVFTGPLETGYVAEKLAGSAPGSIGLSSEVTFEIANFMNGKRSVLDLRNAVSAEFGPQALDKVVNFVKLLEQADLVQVRSRE